MTKERAWNKAQQYRKWANAGQEKLDKLWEAHEAFVKSFDWTEPVKVGHYSQRSHERMFDQRDSQMRKIVELQDKIKSHLSKAENLEAFASRNKGDAEARRTQLRNELDSVITVGSRVHSASFGGGTVVKVYKKSYRIAFDRLKANDTDLESLLIPKHLITIE